MRERGILMTAPNVRSILAGTKTQDRRKVKGAPLSWLDDSGFRPSFVADPRNDLCPYGVPGDRLWVRETWRFEGTDMMRHGRSHCTQDGVVRYLADDTRRTINTDWRNVETWMTRKPQNRPGIHMPRWASRITLEISDVRVQRLCEISEADAMAEGITHSTLNDPRVEYRWLWESINGAGSWDINPWVWVLTFRRINNA